MTNRFDPISLVFFGVGSGSAVVPLYGVLAQWPIIQSVWAFILILSIAMIAFMGNRMIKLFLGGKIVQEFYPHDPLYRVLQSQRNTKNISH